MLNTNELRKAVNVQQGADQTHLFRYLDENDTSVHEVINELLDAVESK